AAGALLPCDGRGGAGALLPCDGRGAAGALLPCDGRGGAGALLPSPAAAGEGLGVRAFPSETLLSSRFAFFDEEAAAMRTPAAFSASRKGSASSKATHSPRSINVS